MADYQLGEVERHPMTLHNDLEESIVSPSLMLHNMAGGGGVGGTRSSSLPQEAFYCMLPTGLLL